MPMIAQQLKVTSLKNVRVVPVEPKVKSAKTRELFKRGVRAKAKTPKTVDPLCYDACVQQMENVMNEREAKSLKIGDRIYYESGDSSDNGDMGTITDKNWMAFEITYDDGLVVTYKNQLAMSIHKARRRAA